MTVQTDARAAKIRLYVEHGLGPGQRVPLSQPQAHYLFKVMRLDQGARVLLFNGRDGEWLAEVVQTAKRGGSLALLSKSRPQSVPPDVWLLFAPVKKARTDFIVEKAVEMGAARIVPVQTEYTNASRLPRARLQATAVEAAEQCGATHVPEVADLAKLPAVLADWSKNRRLLFCDEALAGDTVCPQQAFSAPAAILVGPEGGFSQAERNWLGQLPFTTRISLGPRILRAETAAIAAFALWQSGAGDWG
ncbi:MAG: 16S rRNA (uracil(1498)-N(3))-methyltransferase [Pseudomonadota bacterium]